MIVTDQGRVVAVSRDSKHRFSKTPQMLIRLLAGLGVEGDAHMGERVKHRSRARFNSSLPNLRQVHLLQRELFDELSVDGFKVAPGELGENVTTAGIDLLGLPTGTLLAIGDTAVVEVTGLRNPCVQIDRFQPGLMEAVLERSEGGLVRKSGVMGIVREGGIVQPGDRIAITRPTGPHIPLKPV